MHTLQVRYVRIVLRRSSRNASRQLPLGPIGNGSRYVNFMSSRHCSANTPYPCLRWGYRIGIQSVDASSW